MDARNCGTALSWCVWNDGWMDGLVGAWVGGWIDGTLVYGITSA